MSESRLLVQFTHLLFCPANMIHIVQDKGKPEKKFSHSYKTHESYATICYSYKTDLYCINRVCFLALLSMEPGGVMEKNH